MILELANYTDIIKGKKKKRIQRRRSLSNVSSTDSNHTSITPSKVKSTVSSTDSNHILSKISKEGKSGVIDEVKHKITPIKSSKLKTLMIS